MTVLDNPKSYSYHLLKNQDWIESMVSDDNISQDEMCNTIINKILYSISSTPAKRRFIYNIKHADDKVDIANIVNRAIINARNYFTPTNNFYN